MKYFVTAIAALLSLSTASAAAAPAIPRETEKSAAAVIAVDEHWSRAEIHGDVAYIDALLLPAYRSVAADGAVSGKARILAHARRNGARAAETARRVAQYHQTHPYGTTVVIQGNTALLTFYLKALGPEKGVMSADLFVYSGGRWRALYSQHTTASK